MTSTIPTIVDKDSMTMTDIKLEPLDDESFIADLQQSIPARHAMTEEECHLYCTRNGQTRHDRILRERKSRMYFQPSLLECFSRGVLEYDIDSDPLVSALGEEEVDLLASGRFVVVIKAKPHCAGEVSDRLRFYVVIVFFSVGGFSLLWRFWSPPRLKLFLLDFYCFTSRILDMFLACIVWN